MSVSRKILQTIALACIVYLGLAENIIESEITGYGFASSSNTLYTGAQGSEHSASFKDPGDCATNIGVYPIGTLIYVVGLQKYFSVQDSCGDCSSESQPHFDLWMGAPSYNNLAQLTTCADGITVQNPTATVIINPNSGYFVDTTALMSSTGTCDTDADYSRTQPVLASGNTGGSRTLSTVVSSATAGASASGSCAWDGHCQGAPCQTDSDCSNPYPCVNSVCT